MKFWPHGSAFAAALALIGFATLWALPLRAIDLRCAAPDDAETAPDSSGFCIGGIHWDVDAYRGDRKLEPLRVFFQAHCKGKSGLAAAVCLSDTFAVAFPHGVPARESFDREYDPVADLDVHMRGAPGHCVTRSALISAILLASGISARQVQFIHPEVGHNAMEVWDAGHGWVFFDPTFGKVFTGPRGPLSATAALLRAEGTRAEVAKSVMDASIYAHRRGPEVTLRFPEPWMYARTGSKEAMWPLRARSVEIGASDWRRGPVQHLLRVSIVALTVFALAGAARAAVGRRVRAKRVAIGPDPQVRLADDLALELHSRPPP